MFKYLTTKIYLFLLILLFCPIFISFDSKAEDENNNFETLSESFDKTDPDACEKYQKFIEEKNINPENELVKKLEEEICINPPSDKVVNVVFLRELPLEPGDPLITVDVSGSMYNGNQNYMLGGGKIVFKKRIEDHLLSAVLEGDYSSEKARGKLKLDLAYDYLLTDHWAIFVFSSVKHDGYKNIKFATEEITGPLYNFFSFNDEQKRYFAISTGVGHRYESYTEDYDQSVAKSSKERFGENDLIMSWKVKLEHPIAERMKIVTSLLYQYLLYSRLEDGTDDVLNFNDYTILFNTDIESGIAKNIVVTFGIEDEYYNIPAPGAGYNDIRGKAGVKLVIY